MFGLHWLRIYIIMTAHWLYRQVTSWLQMWLASTKCHKCHIDKWKWLFYWRACRTRTEISSLARFAVQTRTHPPVSEELPRLPDENKFEIVEHHAPRTRSDFEMLRNVLDHWRILENERVDRTLFDSSKMAARAMILYREIELLRSIERAKMQVRDERREKCNLDYLEILAQPEIWR